MIIHSILYLLVSNAVTSRRDKSILYSRNAILILAYCIIINLNGNNVYFLENGIGIFGGLLHVNFIIHNLYLFIFIICIINFHYTSITNKMGEQFQIIEYPLILLFIITGGVLLISK